VDREQILWELRYWFQNKAKLGKKISAKKLLKRFNKLEEKYE